MDKLAFKRMWDAMQRQGYFADHPHYLDHFGAAIDEEELALDKAILSLDFSRSHLDWPWPYSAALERSVKRTEPIWLNRMFELPQSGVALDLGCGFGRSLNWLCERYQHVIGTDISAEVIDSTRKRLTDRSNVSLYVNDADALPEALESASVDVVYAFTVFQHISREFTLGLLTSIQRVLKPEGVVVFNLISSVNEHVNDGGYGTEWAIGYSREQTMALLEQAGLRPVKMVTWKALESTGSWLWVLAGGKKQET